MTTQNIPLVTVYIPTYNRVELLKRAVKSVQEQTYQNLEIIIVDDCSTDGTHVYLAQLAKEDARVRYFLKEANSGACVSRNIAIENANGDFITGLDDDDYFLENRIYDFFKSSHINKIQFTSIIKVDNNKKKKIRLYKSKVVSSDLIYNNYIGNQIFIKTKYLKDILFSPEMKVWQDLECWYRVCDKYGSACLLDNYSYVMDISHESARISLSNKEKIEKSYNFFCKKNKLTKFQEKILFSHIYNYYPEETKFNILLLKLLFNFNFYDLKKLFKKLIGV